VTTPVVELTDAIPELLLDQVPPPDALPRAEVPLTHIVVVPVMPESSVTVTVVVVVHPVAVV
jgi:hypothetical protein